MKTCGNREWENYEKQVNASTIQLLPHEMVQCIVWVLVFVACPLHCMLLLFVFILHTWRVLDAKNGADSSLALVLLLFSRRIIPTLHSNRSSNSQPQHIMLIVILRHASNRSVTFNMHLTFYFNRFCFFVAVDSFAHAKYGSCDCQSEHLLISLLRHFVSI